MIKIHPFIEVFIAAAFGAIFAVILDHAIGKSGSILGHFAYILKRVMPLEFQGIMPIIASVLIAGVLGAVSTFYFRPLSRKGGFACGFSVIGAMSIFLP